MFIHSGRQMKIDISLYIYIQIINVTTQGWEIVILNFWGDAVHFKVNKK